MDIEDFSQNEIIVQAEINAIVAKINEIIGVVNEGGGGQPPQPPPTPTPNPITIQNINENVYEISYEG